MLSVSFVSGMAGILFLFGVVFWVGKFLFFAYKKDYKKAWRSAALFILAGIAALACLSLCDRAAGIERGEIRPIISGDAKGAMLLQYLDDKCVPIKDAWWWDMNPADRATDESKTEMWRYRDIFNSLLDEKCGSKEQWPAYYETVVSRFLWHDVCFRKISPTINGGLSVKKRGPRLIMELFLANQPITIADAWWWHIPRENRLLPETQDKFWEFRDIFNDHLAEKCESREEWAKYYRETVAPCLWYEVYVSIMHTLEIPYRTPALAA